MSEDTRSIHCQPRASEANLRGARGSDPIRTCMSGEAAQLNWRLLRLWAGYGLPWLARRDARARSGSHTPCLGVVFWEARNREVDERPNLGAQIAIAGVHRMNRDRQWAPAVHHGYQSSGLDGVGGNK